MTEKKLIKKYIKSKPLGRRKYFCYGPLTNLYFWQNGHVTSCCYNRTAIGQYPEQTIRQIWQGDPATGLRNKMKERDFSAGCFPCLRDLSSMNFNGFKASVFDHLPVQQEYPSTMEFALSNTCNLACVMCNVKNSDTYAREKSIKTHSSPYDSKFVDQLDEFIPHLKEAGFYGGEPFMIDIYYEIWERIIRINPACHITVQTNASILNEKIKPVLEQVKFGINISIDSLHKEMYETIRKNASFEKVMENIRYFSDYCKRKNTFLCISVCPMKMNWSELPGFIDFCDEHKAYMFFHTVTWPLKLSLKSLSSTEIKEVYDHLSSVKTAKGDRLHNKNVDHYKSFLLQIKAWEKAAIERESGGIASFEIVVAEIEQKIDRAYSEKYFPEDKVEIKRKIILSIEKNKDIIDFYDMHLKLLRTPDVRFAEMIRQKSDAELMENVEKFII